MSGLLRIYELYILKRCLEKPFGKNYLLKYHPPKTAITVTRNAKIPTYKIATIPGNLTNTNFFLAFNCKKYIHSVANV